eukprot:PITA_17999
MEKSWINSLGFVDLMVHGKTIQALVDMGATHNLMTIRLAKEVGLMIFPSNVEVKAVNSRAKVADFLKRNKAIIVPFCDEVVRVGQSQIWTFSTHRQRREVKVQHVSALCLEKAMKESDMETYAVMFKGVEGDRVGTPVPAKISEVLAKYAYLMPNELPKRLPPRCAVDHSIELEKEKQPPAKAPYRLSRPQLEELK